jgi:hypothetical protein
MKMETKQEVFNRYKKEYFEARISRNGRKILTKIIDTVESVTGMGRKSIIRAFNRIQMKDPCAEEQRGRPLYYTPDVTVALKETWEVGGEVCGELLHPMVSEYIEILVRDKMWKHSDEATGKLLAMSMGTLKNRVGNFLKARRKGRGISSTSPSQLKHIIPIFHGDWDSKLPGVGQIDTVVHCGHSLVGDMVFTLNYIDVSTLWDIMRAQWNKGQEATQQSLSYIKSRLPWTMLEVHPDTGSEFINWLMKSWCDRENIAMSRSRPNHKNDNMHVEERNGHVIRKWIGYIRLDCKEDVDALNAVYEVLSPYLNHFVASKRIVEKYEIDGKWKKKYEKVVKTPYRRVLENRDISDEVKEKLQQEHAKLNPAIMKKEIDRLKKILYDTQKKYGKSEF